MQFLPQQAAFLNILDVRQDTQRQRGTFPQPVWAPCTPRKQAGRKEPVAGRRRSWRECCWNHEITVSTWENLRSLF